MTRVVGRQDRDEFELDPAEAHRRGRKLARGGPPPEPASLSLGWNRTNCCACWPVSRPKACSTSEGVEVRTLDIEGLLKTKTIHCDKDRIDREALSRLSNRLRGG